MTGARGSASGQITDSYPFEEALQVLLQLLQVKAGARITIEFNDSPLNTVYAVVGIELRGGTKVSSMCALPASQECVPAVGYALSHALDILAAKNGYVAAVRGSARAAATGFLLELEERWRNWFEGAPVPTEPALRWAEETSNFTKEQYEELFRILDRRDWKQSR